MEKVLFNLVSDPKESHFHCSCTLFLDSVIGYASRCGIVTMDRGWWLWVSKFLKDEALYFAFFAIEEKGSKLCFCC
jgi:hypothetical protein